MSAHVAKWLLLGGAIIPYVLYLVLGAMGCIQNPDHRMILNNEYQQDQCELQFPSPQMDVGASVQRRDVLDDGHVKERQQSR